MFRYRTLLYPCLYCLAALLVVVYLLPSKQIFVEEQLGKLYGEYIENSTVGGNNESAGMDSTPSSYFVDRRHCRIPYVDPFDAEALAIYKPMVFESCSNESTLVNPIYNKTTRRYYLHVNESLASQLLNSTEEAYTCFYQKLARLEKHDSHIIMKPTFFSQDFEVPQDVQGLLTGCFRKGKISDTLQYDAFNLVQHREASEAAKVSQDPATRKPSVIMFGIDSLSRINLRRTMPKVFGFLQRKGWYEMQGYNKIADNTFPNLMGFLTGLSLESAKNICDWREAGCLNRYPFAWNHFQEAGYMTAYAEDETYMSSFNLEPAGFAKQPTDYYQRPNQQAFESILPSWKCADCSMKYCMGRRITSSYVYDFGREFVQRYIEERPLWALLWSNSFSHDDFRMPSKMQDFVLQYLLDFEADGVFDKSIVIFLADHGSRFGPLMSLSSGFLESRLPAMFVYLPPWFRTQYPEYARALQQNQRRLTSNYDLYNTLMHILAIGQPGNKMRMIRAPSCPKCRSLFEPPEEERTCEDAGIPDYYCTCHPYKRIWANWTLPIAPLVVSSINGYLAKRKLSGICAKLSLLYVHSTDMKIDMERSYREDAQVEVAVYRILFKVNPTGADFGASVVYNNVTQFAEVNVPSISRMSAYEGTSQCVDNKTDKLFCICKPKSEKYTKERD
ncbi:hypothetical protein KR018_011984 [Drosophila ironensis]|nr:hypothetical protein KR018_011984 [Drosophila ironensis]